MMCHPVVPVSHVEKQKMLFVFDGLLNIFQCLICIENFRKFAATVWLKIARLSANWATVRLASLEKALERFLLAHLI